MKTIPSFSKVMKSRSHVSYHWKMNNILLQEELIVRLLCGTHSMAKSIVFFPVMDQSINSIS